MFGEKREVSEVGSKSGGKLYMVLILLIGVSIGLGYFIVTNHSRAHLVSKSTFICTMVEQVGKNMDDVVCVQYTNQKFHKEVVAMNKLAGR